MKKEKLYLDNSLPHSFLAEKAILSCILTSREALEISIQNVPVDAFYFKNHQELYKAMNYMSKKQLPVDIITLTDFLQDYGLLNDIGGIQVLLDLLDQVPNLVYLEEYIRIVKDKYFRRSLIKFGYKLSNSGHVTNLSFEKILDNLEIELFNLSSEIKTKKTVTNAQLLNNLFLEIKEKFLNPKLTGLNSGFSELDSFTQGFQKSDLIILAGRPSMGKTALSLNFALNTIKFSRLPVLFFSLEMSKEQIMYRILSSETGINQMRLRSGKLYQNDWIKLTKVMKIVAKLPFFIEDKPNLTITDIRSKIKTIISEQTQLGLVIIDYLQLMQLANNKNVNRVQEISQITRSLKSLAREFNLPIIALSQLSRNIENRIDQRPILSDLRESGSIEQDADLVLMLYRPKSVPTSQTQLNIRKITELIIAKQRNGPTGSVKLTFNENQIKFVEFDI